jgi:tetratricopeptide (TPR) repeat protein
MSWLIELLGMVWLAVVPASHPAAAHQQTTGIGQAAFERATCETSFGLTATSACTRAITSGEFSNRDLARLHARRADAFREIGALDAALTDYDAAIALDPTDPASFSRRADAWRDKGAFDLAIADYGEAIRLDPLLVSALVQRGLIYERQRQLGRARADFAAALALPPRYSNSYGAQDTARERLALRWDATPAAAEPEPR